VLVIEVFECFGKVVFSATKSLERLENRNFDLEVRKPSLNGLYGELKIDAPGTIFLSVKAVNGIVDADVGGEKEALFKIQTKLFTLGDKFPYDYFIPGDEGRLQWNILSDGKVRIQWTDSSFDQESDDASFDSVFKDYNISYQYKMVVTKSPILADSLARCDFYPNAFEGEFTNLSDYKVVMGNITPTSGGDGSLLSNYDLELENGGDYYVNLVQMTAGVKGDQVVWEFPIIYETTQVNLSEAGSEEERTFLMWVVIVSVAGLLVVGSALMYYFKRYKRVVAKLNYEMQDVRNIAAINTEEVLDDRDRVIDVGKAKYTGLVEERSSP